jgi:hypothetical protein
MTMDSKYLITFDLIFNRNPSMNDEPLIQLLNSFGKNSKSSIEEALLTNFDECFDLINNFGIGILIFPNLILSMDGTY